MAASIRSSDVLRSNEGADCGFPSTLVHGDCSAYRSDHAEGSGEESTALLRSAGCVLHTVADSSLNGCANNGTGLQRGKRSETVVHHETSEHADVVTSTKSLHHDANDSENIKGAKKGSTLSTSTFAQCAASDQITACQLKCVSCSVSQRGLPRGSPSLSVARDENQPIKPTHAPFLKDREIARSRRIEQHGYLSSEIWAMGQRKSSSNFHSEIPENRKTNSPVPCPRHSVSFSALHHCEQGATRQPRKFMSTEKGTSPNKIEKMNEAEIVSLCRKTIALRWLSETQHNEIDDTGVSKAKRPLSVILDTEDGRSTSVSLAESVNVEPRPHSQDPARADHPVLAESTTAAHLYQCTASRESDIHDGRLESAFANFEVDEGNQIMKKCCPNITNNFVISKGLAEMRQCSDAISKENAEMTQCSDEQHRTDSVLLDIEQLDYSSRTGIHGLITPQDRDRIDRREADSSDSAQLSPQPELSLAWTGSGSTHSWSTVEPGFLRSQAPTLWAPLSVTCNDETVTAEASGRVKTLSFPDRPSSPEKDEVWMVGIVGRAKKTVSCPLSFEAESICYETGDQEAFIPRQSTSNCWCCDKDERGVENNLSAHMDIQECLRFQERLGQWHRSVAPQNDIKNDHSSLERELDMATLDCYVPALHQHKRAFEHFSKLSSSSLPEAVDSLEEWFREGLPLFYEQFPDDRHGTILTKQLGTEEMSEAEIAKNSTYRTNFSAGNEDSTEEEGDVQAPNRKIKAGVPSNRTLRLREEIANDGIPGGFYKSEKCDSPTEAFEGSGESPGATTPKTVASDIVAFSPLDALSVNFINARFSGMELADQLDKFATGLGLSDIMFLPCRPHLRLLQAPCLDDVDFSMFLSDDTLPVPEALARMPKIVCSKSPVKK